MAGADWILKGALERALREIRVTRSMDDLLQEVVRFVAELPAVERASVPHGYLPRHIRTQQDLSHWADRVLEPGGEGAAFAALREVLASAALHAQRLRPRREPPTDYLRVVRRGSGE